MINPEALRSWENWFMVLIIVMVGWGTAAVLQQFIQSAINIHSCDPAHMIFLLGNTNSLFCIDLINVISRCVCSLSSCLKITFVGAFFAWFVISLGNCFPLYCIVLSVPWEETTITGTLVSEHREQQVPDLLPSEITEKVDYVQWFPRLGHQAGKDSDLKRWGGGE